MSLNITSKQTTIKLGPHRGEEMYVMKVDHYSTVGCREDHPVRQRDLRHTQSIVAAGVGSPRHCHHRLGAGRSHR